MRCARPWPPTTQSCCPTARRSSRLNHPRPPRPRTARPPTARNEPAVAQNNPKDPAADEALLTALACGASVEVAAQKAGIGRSTAYRRAKSAAFRRRLKALRLEMVEKTSALLTAAGNESVRTLLLLQQPNQ